ncbi:amidase [Hirsutella rhossiliensis]|uniref:Amidase domain-containing protein n=1 Tax=Hirsutella rhossiliensis TaxID=111463 RepID=A0A9P8N510_9HYPO|nr:amidase domain-containing protein [Hirsutella rhossiliensis]KAH0966041.1 amidase domain-containing protein [Hirsutella rhossiliensis]
MVRGALLADRCFPTSQSVVNRAINIMTKAPTPTPFAAARLEGGCVFSVAGGQYFVPPSKPNAVARLPWAHDFGLVSVLRVPQHRHGSNEKRQITASWVQDTVHEYEQRDDVFDTAFLATVIFHGADERSVTLTDEAREYLGKLGNKQVAFIAPPELPHLLPGPYLLVGHELRDVWKLAADTHGASMVTLEPKLSPDILTRLSSSDAFESFQFLDTGDQSPIFALQSRTKARAVFHSPLAGLRMVIKDNIHLRGIKTSAGNRAFYDTFPPCSETAECVQKLLDQGVSLVGKTKMNSFGIWEEPIEYVDYQAPWNPRADRYQSPGGSSSGSAAAIAAYDWLDIAIGTDTWGSVTRPAHWCGCFGLRPTLGALSPQGIVPYCQTWDTAGILTRDLGVCKDVAAEWLDANALQSDPQPFSSVIWAKDFWNIIEDDQINTARDFANKVASVLNISGDDVSFEEAWTKSPPAEANGASLLEFITEATGAQSYDAYHNCQPFVEQYRKKFNHAPYISPRNQSMWNFAKNVSKEKRDEDFAKLDVFEKWFHSTILTEKHSNPLIIMPLECVVPRYRDNTPTFRRPPQDGVGALALGPVMKSPVLAVPLTDIPYLSRITNQQERLPFVLAVMGKPGTDLALIDAIYSVLEKTGSPTAVKAGKLMF